MVYHIDWSAYNDESLHPWDKPHLIMVYAPFNVLYTLRKPQFKKTHVPHCSLQHYLQ